MTHSPALTLARDRLKLIRNHTSVNPHQIEIIDEALAAIDAELAASADAGKLIEDFRSAVVCAERDGGMATTERIQITQQALLAALARPAPAGTAYIPHDYQGACPDDTQPNARDPECAACRAMGVAPATGKEPLQVAPVSAQGDERERFEGQFAYPRGWRNFTRNDAGYYVADEGRIQAMWAAWHARAQVAQGDEVDAARYREWQRLYLSADDTDDDANLVLSVAETPEEIDAALDAARAQQGGQPPC